MKLQALLVLTFTVTAAVAVAVPASPDPSVAQARPLRSRPRNGIKNTQYDENWAGAVISKSAGTFSTISATVTAPTPTSTGGSNTQYGAAWVGIDGDTCQNAILQTGFEWTIYPNQSYSYGAWYEWYPDVAYFLPNFPILAGHVLVLTVVASSSTVGNIVIENKNTGQRVVKQLSSKYALCGQDAEWIVEDFSNGDLVPFSNFSPVRFSGSYAYSAAGQIFASNQAGLMDISQRGKVLTTSSLPDRITVLVKHT